MMVIFCTCILALIVRHFASLVLVNSTAFLALGASDIPQNRQNNNFALCYIHMFHYCLCCRPTATAAARSTTTRAATKSSARGSTVIALVNRWGYSPPCVIPNNDKGPQTRSSDKSFTLNSFFSSFGLSFLLCSVDYRKIFFFPPVCNTLSPQVHSSHISLSIH